MRLKFVVVLAILTAAPIFADCVNCEDMDCSYMAPDGSIAVTIAPQCTHNLPPPGEYGYLDCRNVANCGGCIGWTCFRQEQAGQSKDIATRERLTLQRATVQYLSGIRRPR